MATPLSFSAHAAEPIPASISSSASEWNLVLPTEEKPQIKMTGRSVSYASPTSIAQPKKKKDSALCQGLVYLYSEQERPDLSEVLVLTAASPSQPDAPVLGAKFNIYKAKFPFEFTMAEPNRLKGHESDAIGGDWIVTARSCPSDGTLPCSDQESTFVARGVSKVLVGTGEEGGLLKEGESVRTPASLALRRNGAVN